MKPFLLALLLLSCSVSCSVEVDPAEETADAAVVEGGRVVSESERSTDCTPVWGQPGVFLCPVPGMKDGLLVSPVHPGEQLSLPVDNSGPAATNGKKLGSNPNGDAK